MPCLKMLGTGNILSFKFGIYTINTFNRLLLVFILTVHFLKCSVLSEMALLVILSLDEIQMDPLQAIAQALFASLSCMS